MRESSRADRTTNPPATRSPRSTARQGSPSGSANRCRSRSTSSESSADDRRDRRSSHGARALDFGAMPTFRAPRGTRDLLPEETPLWTRLERLAADLAARYGYRRIETPMFEQTSVFERGVGEVTDIVEKELFRIAPRTEESEAWALRPEPTAGIVR